MIPEVTAQDVEDGWRLRRLAWGHLPALAFQAACRHNLFGLLEESGPLSAAGLAQLSGLNSQALALMLEGLAALDLVTVEGGLYSNAAISSRMLVKGRPLCQLDIILRKQVNESTVQHSEEVLRKGHLPSPPVPRGRLQDVLEATRESALLSVARIVQLAPPGPHERLLDVAGAPGVYSLAYAAARPDLEAVILELPEVAPTVAELVAGEGRISVLAGDMYSSDLAGDYSLILLSNVIHFVDEPRLDSLISRLAGALRPGGRLVIHDSLRGDDGRGPLYNSLLALLIMSLSPGDSFTLGRVNRSLLAAGLQLDPVIDLEPEPASLLVARRA